MHFEHQFAAIIDSHLQSVQQSMQRLPNVNIIRLQLSALKKLPHITPHTSIADLPNDQYKAITVLTNMMGSHRNQWPYFFLTGSAGTGKSFIIHLFRNHLHSRRIKYLVLAPTGVAAQNVDGQTIHSALKISSSNTNYQSSYKTLLFTDVSLQNKMRNIKTLIIDEVSMEVRLGRISDNSWHMLQAKNLQHVNTESDINSFNTTFIVGYKESAERINISFCNLLEITCENDILISTAVDKVNDEEWDNEYSQPKSVDSISTPDNSGEEQADSKDKSMPTAPKRALRSNDKPKLPNLASDILNLPSYKEP
ncbi:8488_t:CDS:2 [Paraglomus occultum]|uniref:ATP-dependent DNA helicase n=1 Tax=Paraglomus occultum TaxID=144539 RepID=A0A9N8WMG6_9GLOM|nr:8488_t:CDS:2 [Paraglomus occultum]